MSHCSPMPSGILSLRRKVTSSRPASLPNRLALHLLVLWALCLFAAPLAHSQVSAALVSNIAETTRERGTGAFSIRHAQGFETGNNPPGYTVTGVDLDLDVAASGDTPVYTVEIWSDSAGSPGSRLGSLSPPSSIGSGVNSFTTPGIDLDDLEGYFVVVNLATPGAKYSWLGTSSNNETSSQGWQISDSSSIGAEFNESTWFTDSREVRKLRINGLVKPDVTVEVTLDEDTSHPLAAADFTDDDTLEGTGVRILTLPGLGSLTLDGASPGAPAVSVTANQLVSKTDITEGKLKYTPARNDNGNVYASLTFKVNDGTSDSTDTFTMIINVTPVNDAATGTPTISGVARAGEPLTAGTGDIDDTEGVPSRFIFQWVRVGSDGSSNPTNVGANSNTYTLADADVGMKIKVRVSFNDDDGHSEGPLESDAYPTGTDTIAAIPPCGNPDHAGGSLQRWTRDMTVGNSGSVYGFREGTGGFGELGSNSERLLNFGVDGVIRITAVTLSSGTLTFGLSRALPTRLRTQMALHVCDRIFPVSADSTTAATWTNTGLDWSGTRNRTLYVSRDGQVPRVSSATVNGATLKITFDEDLDATVPPSSAFTVKRTPYGGEEETISASGTPAISGTTLTLTLAEPMTHIHTNVKVKYSQPSNNRLTDRRSNAVASFSDAPVTNNTPSPMFSIAVDPTNIAEDGGEATVTVSILSPLSIDQTIDLTLGGTAKNPDDYTISADSLTLTAGQTSVTATVMASNDNYDDDAETVIVTARNVGRDIGAVTVTIDDDDAPVALSFSVNNPSIAEAGGTSTLTVSTGGSTLATALTIPLTLGGTATNPDDYTISADSLTLPANTTSITATVTAVQDTIDEPNETVLITASHNGTTIGTQQTVTITDDDTATLSVSVSQATILRDGGTSRVIVSTGGTTFSTDQTIALTLAGTATKDTDYTIDSESLTLRAGESSVAATITSTNDPMANSDETVLITASHNGTTIGAQQTVTISAPVPPEVSDAYANGTFLTLDFDEDLKPGATPAGGAFTVTEATQDVTVYAVVRPANKPRQIILRLVSAVVHGNNVTLSYTVPNNALNRLQDSAGNHVAAITRLPVRNTTSRPQTPIHAATGEPAISGMAELGETLTASPGTIADQNGIENAVFVYQWVRVTGGLGQPDIDGAGSSAYIVAAEDIGTRLKVRAEFTDDEGYSEARTSAATAVIPDTLVPELRAGGAKVNGGTLRLQYDEALNANSRPAASAFAVTVGGQPATLTGVAIDGDTVTLTLSAEVARGDAVTVSYTKPAANPVEDLAGNDAGNLSSVTVANKTSAPPEMPENVIVSSRLNDALVFTWSRPQDDGGAATDGYDHRFALGSSVPSDTPWVTVGTENFTTFLFLRSGTEYAFEVRARNIYGPGPAAALTATTTGSTDYPATGAPTISGTVAVRSTLTASTAGIDDANGVSGATYGFQWFQVKGGSATAINGETTGSYKVRLADIGGTLKVRVSFTDDGGFSESVTSAETAVVPDADNEPPTSRDASLVLLEDGRTYTFKASDFPFSDEDTDDELQGLQVVTPPSAGTLRANRPVTGVEDVARENIDHGGLTYRPGANGHGTPYADFTFRVFDGTDYSEETYTFTIDVTAQPDDPTGAPSISGTAEVGRTLTADISGIGDVDGLQGAEFAYQWVHVDDDGMGGATETDIAGATDAAYTLGDGDLGKRIKVKVTFTDDRGDMHSLASDAFPQTGSVEAANTPPTAAGGTVTIDEDTPHTFNAANFNFSDADSGDALASVTIVSLPAAGSLTLAPDGGGAAVAVTENQSVAAAAIGRLAFTPAADGNGTGYASFTFKVNDGKDDSALSYTMTVNVTAVSDPPTAADGTLTIDEDTAGTFRVADFNFSDADSGDALASVTIVSLPAAGSLTLAPAGVGAAVAVTENQSVAAAAIGRLTFTPAADGSGTGYASFTFKVNDGEDDSALSYTMTVNVTGANDPPTAENGINTLPENGVIVFTAFRFRYDDIDGDPLASLTILTVPAAGSLTLDTRNTEDPPVVVPVAVSANQVISGTDLAARRLKYTPAPNASGSPYANFEFRVNDGTVDSLASYTFTINVRAINEQPTSADASVTTLEDTNYTFAVADFGFSDPDGDDLDSVTIVSVEGNGGMIRKRPAGEIMPPVSVSAADIDADNLIFVPDRNEHGSASLSFRFTVSDGSISSAVHTMTIDVEPVNDWPSSSDKTVTTQEDTHHVFTVADFNFRDPDDGDQLESVKILSLPAAGSLAVDAADPADPPVAVTANQAITRAQLDAGALKFTPEEDASGAAYATFTFKVNDGEADSGRSRTMTIEVLAVNDPPTSANNRLSASEDEAYVFSLADFSYHDLEGQPLHSVRVVALPEGGELRSLGRPLTQGQRVLSAALAGGHFRYVPAADENGAGYASFTFKVNDGRDDSAGTYTMTFDVAARNDPPRGEPVILGEAVVGSTVTADTSGITDVDGLVGVAFAYQWIRIGIDEQGNPTGTETEIGTATMPSYAVTEDDASSSLKVKVTFTDDGGTTASLTSAQVMVPAGNQAPEGSDGYVSIDEDNSHVFAISDFGFYDFDFDDALSSVRIVTLPGKGGLKLYTENPNDPPRAVVAQQSVNAADIDAGKLRFEPAPDESAYEPYTSFTFKVSDGRDEAEQANTLTIYVEPVPDPATGDPVITGTAQVGGTLRVDTSAIEDVDGLQNVRFDYQWIRVDGGNETDISGANGIAYQPNDLDGGKKLKVKVRFTDDQFFPEERFSAPTDVGDAGQHRADGWPPSCTPDPVVIADQRRQPDLAGDLQRGCPERGLGGLHGHRHDRGTLTADAVSGSSLAYDVTATGGNLAGLDGTVTLSFAVGQNITDTAGNALANTAPTETNDNTYVLDNTGPTVTISGVPGTSSAAFTATITFLEGVTGFAVEDIAVGNGAASNFTGSDGGTAFTALITPTADGEVTVDVAAGVATDAAGNGNTAATRVSSTYTAPDTTAPRVASIARQTPSSSPTNANSLTWRVTFSEDVQNVDTADFTVSGTTATLTAAAVPGSSLAYDVTATGGNLAGLDGTVTLSFAVGQNITDTTSNALANTAPTGANDNTFVLDNTGPTVTISDVPGTSSAPFTATITFLEGVTGFAVEDITVGNGAASNFTGSDGGTAFTARITPAADGEVTVDVAAGVATDAAGNGNTAATRVSSTYTAPDTTAPRVASIARQTPSSSPTNANSLTWRVTFSEDVQNVDTADFTVSGTTATLTAAAVPGSSLAYDVTATGGNLAGLDGTVTLSFAVGQNITDTTSNALANTAPTGANDNTFVLDNTGPTVTISDVPGTSSAPFTATITFLEGVTGFAVEDITVGNGAASNFTGSDGGTAFTARITPAADGEVTVDVAAGVATDTAGNGNTAATRVSSTYTAPDTTAPRVASIARQTPSSSPTNANSLTWRVTFSEDVQNVDTADFTVSGTTATLTAAAVPGLSLAYDVTATGGNLAGLDGTVTLSFAVGQNITDTTSNALANTAPTGANDNTFVLDNTGPTVTISDVPGTSSAPFTATITFLEGVTGFAVEDITVGNGAASNFTGSDGGTAFTARITPAADGEVTVDVAAGVATDAAGNGNTAATRVSSTYTAPDTTAPRVASIARQTPSSSPTNANSLTWRVTFSEDVQNVDTADFTVSGTTATLTAAAVPGSSLAYDVTATGGNLAGLDGTVTLSFAVGQNITDTTSNALANTAPTGANDNTFVLDNTGPTVTISDVPGTSSAPFTATITFLEGVTGFAVEDITVGNGAASNFTGSDGGTAFTARITPAADGEVTVDVAAGVATDAAGNGNTAATRVSSTYTAPDTTAPRVASIARQTPSSSPTNANSLTWRVTFSEDVQNVDTADFTVSGTTATLTAAAVPGLSLAYDVTATGGNLAGLDGTVTLSFAVGQNITDTTSNALANTAPTGAKFDGDDHLLGGGVLDNTGPTVTISDVPGTSSAPFTATITFLEGDVDTADFTVSGTTATLTAAGFAVEDITVGNGAASNFTGSDGRYGGVTRLRRGSRQRRITARLRWMWRRAWLRIRRATATRPPRGSRPPTPRPTPPRRGWPPSPARPRRHRRPMPTA